MLPIVLQQRGQITDDSELLRYLSFLRCPLTRGTNLRKNGSKMFES